MVTYMQKTLKKTPLRPAIAMVELIFAIVIIGISLLSAPMIIGQTVKSINTTMQQEAIAAAASQISLILTYPWDENTSTTVGGSGILQVNAGSPALSFVTRDTNFTRQYNPLAFRNASTLLGPDTNDIDGADDLDDFHGQSSTLTLYANEEAALSNNEGEYIDTSIVMSNQVVYGADVTSSYTTDMSTPVQFNNPFQVSSASTDIKIITVSLTSNPDASEQAKLINLSAFACNIGSARLISPKNLRNIP